MGAMDERQRRLWAGQEAQALGYGGIAIIARATGLARNTIRRGLAELPASGPSSSDRVRRPGAGRKATTSLAPGLGMALEELLEPRAERDSPLRWTGRSTRQLAEALNVQGYRISHTFVAGLLHELGYSLRTNRRTREGAGHREYDAQFGHVRRAADTQLQRGQPVIAVDITGRVQVRFLERARKAGSTTIYPGQVQVRDIPGAEQGRPISFGAYEVPRGAGSRSRGAGQDAAAFAVATIGRWWLRLGRSRFARARSLLIIAERGGDTVFRLRRFRWELQQLAGQTGLVLSVCHLPPGIRKWSRIEHRLLALVRQDRHGHALPTGAAIVSLIAAAGTKALPGLDLVLDAQDLPPSRSVRLADEQPEPVNLQPSPLHAEWNYAIHPRRSRS